MGEKRFVLCKKGDVEYIEDNCCVQLYGFDVLCEMLNEQQATIRKLQDLCGESDGENAKLRIKNKKLKEENEKLIQKKCLPCELVNLQTREIDKLKEENEKLNKLLNEAEDLIESRLAVHFAKQYENIKHNIIGD